MTWLQHVGLTYRSSINDVAFLVGAGELFWIQVHFQFYNRTFGAVLYFKMYSRLRFHIVRDKVYSVLWNLAMKSLDVDKSRAESKLLFDHCEAT